MAAAGLSSLPTTPSGGPAPRRMPPAHWAGAARLTNGVGASGPPSLYAGAQRRGRLRREVGSRGSCPAISSVSSSLAARSRDASVPDLGGVQPRGREALPRRPHEGESLAGAGGLLRLWRGFSTGRKQRLSSFSLRLLCPSISSRLTWDPVRLRQCPQDRAISTAVDSAVAYTRGTPNFRYGFGWFTCR